MSRALAVALAPVILLQARALRRRVPSLPEAEGPREGRVAGPDPMRLIVVGDSTAVGTGVARLEDALPGALARRLATTGGVAWRALGRSGDTSGEVLARIGPGLAGLDADVAVVLVGWNDAMRLRSSAAFRRDLTELLALVVAGSPRARLVVVAPPVFGRFPALPRPLRDALGRHAAGLHRVAAAVAALRGAALVPGLRGDAVASDGFHPDAEGYDRLAASIARTLDLPTERN